MTRPDSGLLNQPGDLYEPYEHLAPAEVVRRRPAVYSPPSTARVNVERLPPAEQMTGMQLAYREQPFSDGRLLAWAGAAIGGVFLFTFLAAFGVAIGGRLLPWDLVPTVAGSITVSALGWMFVAGKVSPSRVTLILVGPFVGLLALKIGSLLFFNRALGCAACATVMFLTVWKFGATLPDLYMQWLYAHPRLRPATRSTRPRTHGPDIMYLAAVTGCAIIVGAFSPLIAMLLIAALSVLITGTGPDRRTGTRIFREAFALAGNATYFGSGAPGTWSPDYSRSSQSEYRAPVWLTVVIYAPLSLTLAAGLSLFFPDTFWYWITSSGATLELFTVRMITRSPTWWVEESYRRLMDGSLQQVWTLAIAMVFGAILPPIVVVSAYWRSVTQIWETRRRLEWTGPASEAPEDALDADDRVEWQWYVDRLQDSPHAADDPLTPGTPGTIREADHLFLGVQPHAQFPVLLHKPILKEHAYIVGDTGSGKTSLGLMPMLIQLIRGNACPDPATGEARRPDPSPVVILDLKGDNALFQLAKREAEARGQEFRFFTPEKNMASHVFNPVGELGGQEAVGPSIVQTAQLLLDSLGLNHGEGYGRSYYSRQSRRALLEVLSDEKGPPESIEQLAERLKSKRAEDPEVFRDTAELLATIYALSKYPNLSGSTEGVPIEDQIHMPTVLDRSQVVYFWLPSAVESASVREIGKLALYSLLGAAIRRQRQGLPIKQSYVVIDEFQRIAGENFKVILEQSRSFGLGLILANQSVADLKTPAIDLKPTIRSNTRLKRYFSVTDVAEIESISRGSGEEVVLLRQWSQDAGVSAHDYEVASSFNRRSDTQAFKPALSVSDILATSDHPLDSIVHVSRGSGYTQFGGLPLRVRCTWPMRHEDYQHLESAPWPTAPYVDRPNDRVARSDDSSPSDEPAPESRKVLQTTNTTSPTERETEASRAVSALLGPIFGMKDELQGHS